MYFSYIMYYITTSLHPFIVGLKLLIPHHDMVIEHNHYTPLTCTENMTRPLDTIITYHLKAPNRPWSSIKCLLVLVYHITPG